MKSTAALLLLLTTSASCASTPADVTRCEELTIVEAGLTDATMVKDQKELCRVTPEYQICMNIGFKQARDAGALPSIDQLKVMHENCSLESDRASSKG